MAQMLKKFRLSAPLKSGRFVASDDPETAIKACLPDYEVRCKMEGRRWYHFEVDPALPFGWPRNIDKDSEEDYGNVVIVEYISDILVARSEDAVIDKEAGEEDSKDSET